MVYAETEGNEFLGKHLIFVFPKLSQIEQCESMVVCFEGRGYLGKSFK